MRLKLHFVDIGRKGRRLELLVYRGDLVFCRLSQSAIARRIDVGTHVHRDLRPVVPVPLHLTDLHLQKNGCPDKSQRNEGHENDRDHHREVTAKSATGLPEN